ncbi:MAG: DUF302 domain-containing protein [Fimbriimonadaceae bacterium]|nr:DUF302 domain-containing protein [Fimbriimonadaceae bacterium]
MNRSLLLPFLILAAPSFGWAPQASLRPELHVRSPHSFEKTVQRLKDASAEAKFSVVFELDVTARAKEKDIVIPPTTILGVCSAKYASAVLAADLRAVPNLPCRIAVTERDGRVDVWTMDVLQIAEHYSGETMGQTAREIDTTVRKILAAGTALTP